MIKYSSLVFIHNVIYNKKPKCILGIYRTNRFLHNKGELSLQNIPKNTKYFKFFLQEHTVTYNRIPYDIKKIK